MYSLCCCEEPKTRGGKVTMKDVMLVDNQNIEEALNTEVKPAAVSFLPAATNNDQSPSVDNSASILSALSGESTYTY